MILEAKYSVAWLGKYSNLFWNSRKKTHIPGWEDMSKLNYSEKRSNKKGHKCLCLKEKLIPTHWCFSKMMSRKAALDTDRARTLLPAITIPIHSWHQPSLFLMRLRLFCLAINPANKSRRFSNYCFLCTLTAWVFIPFCHSTEQSFPARG